MRILSSCGLGLLVATGVLVGCGDSSQPGEPGDPVPPDSLIQTASLGDNDTFGSIDRVWASGDQVLVLDGMNKRVHRFGADGTPLGAFGKEGQGPAEFMLPSAVSVSSNGTIHVLDPMNGRIALLVTEGAGSMEWSGAVRLDRWADDMCLLGDRIFVLGLYDGMMIHEVSPEGEWLGSFGQPIPEDPILREMFSAGQLLCDEERQTIVHVPMTFPQVQAFSAEGADLWNVDLADYHQTQYEFGSRGITPGLDEEGKAHALRSVATLGPDTMLVQLMLDTGPQGPRVLETQILSLATGNGLGPLDLPPIAAVGGGHVLSPVETPFPVIQVHERPSGR